ncbi:hypothetical protein VST7929_00384 [Vibrio stylophorae]|uniref:TRAP C4-dicarboxylate transport system permease DctM subunit domain-containing protein n=1 Tax=Vibrio stylophorae TaxID=659351 RepID=A0ABM8ZQK2_9VIBR|nr:TRAP transporter permease [Vibrio stylophorae]CAH0532553.1 hypothetical protein VST7929_00384 [Vibrio stylophorae]
MNQPHATAQDAQEMVAQADSGARNPQGFARHLLWYVPLCWSFFQLWYASPFPTDFNIGVFTSTQARSIHLAFAVFLAFMAYPAFRRSPRDRIPLFDWIFALFGSFAAAYIYIFHEQLANRAGAPTQMDIIFAVIGMVLLLEATRRALGAPLMIVATLFLTYAFAGPYMPDVIAHKGASINKAMSHLWLTTEGVFGVALRVSVTFVFLFVLFGAMLEKAGAGSYFIRVAFSLLGHMRGGPAKASVVASGLSGMVSGSSIANVVTTGTFTIPLMKRVGFPGTKAGAVEVAASTNGQLTPPVMGAAAFLMVEYVGISYIEVIKHAFLPAIISYIALLYIVHLEALKAGMQGLPRHQSERALAQSATMCFVIKSLYWLTIPTLVIALSFFFYYGLSWVKTALGAATIYFVLVLSITAYLGLIRISARYYAPEIYNHDQQFDELPAPLPTFLSGLHFLLPIVILVWCLTVERLSPGLSAFWASCMMIFILITQHPLIRYFRRQMHLSNDHENAEQASLRSGCRDVLESMVIGARNMIGIGVATAAAGVVVGVVTLTGIGLILTEFVEFISGGNMILMLIFTAVISLLLGMGLPTTANYIVVSTLMAPVIVELGGQHGLIVPLIAVHLFVFYFGILADDTPPVGLAAFAAAAIAKSDPIRTGIQGFTYDIRTAILPFMFIFNTQLLMIGIDSLWHLALTVTSATIAILLFSAATQGYWLTRNKWWETLLLLVFTFSLFRPGFWWDKIYPATETYPGSQLVEIADQLAIGEPLNLQVSGLTIEGDEVSKIVHLPFDEKAKGGLARVESTGLILSERNEQLIVDMVAFDSPADKAKIQFDWQIEQVILPADRPMKEWLFIPVLFLVGLMAWNQKRRLPHQPIH